MSINNIQNFQLSSALAVGYLQFLHTNILFALLSWTPRVIWMVFVVVLFCFGMVLSVLYLVSFVLVVVVIFPYYPLIFQFSNFILFIALFYIVLFFLCHSFLVVFPFYCFLFFLFFALFVLLSYFLHLSFCLFFPSFLTPHSAFYFNSLENTCSSYCIHMLM